MTAPNPFIEDPKHAERNRRGERSIRVSPATLTDGRDGVALFIGRFSICVSIDSAFKIAEKLVHVIDLQKGNND